MATPDGDLLGDVAVRMHRGSAQHCDDVCRAYHGVWGFLRLFEVLPSVGKDNDVLLDRLADEARVGARRILISGSADCGILSYVIAAFTSVGVKADVHVTDRCETPLETIRWYGEQRGWDVTTSRGDIREFSSTTDFDLVVAHNFLRFFSAEARADVVRAWRGALRPGGRVLTISRIKPGGPVSSPRFGPERTEQLVEAMLLAHRSSAHADAIDAAELEALVRGYAARRKSQGPRSTDELSQPFEAAGLRVLSITGHSPVMPGVDREEPDNRMCLLAERPDEVAAGNSA